jgi:hypothetical protein
MNVERLPPKQRGRLTADGFRLTAYGLQFTAYGPDKDEIRIVEDIDG